MFAGERKDIQIETLRTQQLVQDIPNQKPLKIEKNNVMGILLQNNHYTLVVVNITKKVFSFIDPYFHEPPNGEIVFKNFLKFIQRHNQVHTVNCIERKDGSENRMITHFRI